MATSSDGRADVALKQTAPRHTLRKCEGGVDVVGVVTPLVRGGAQVFCMEIRLSSSEKGEDGEGQIEVEEERGELKERRT